MRLKTNWVQFVLPSATLCLGNRKEIDALIASKYWMQIVRSMQVCHSKPDVVKAAFVSPLCGSAVNCARFRYDRTNRNQIKLQSDQVPFNWNHCCLACIEQCDSCCKCKIRVKMHTKHSWDYLANHRCLCKESKATARPVTSVQENCFALSEIHLNAD